MKGAMALDLEPYPTYRRTGVEGLASIPQQWEMVPLKHCVKINAEVLPESTDPALTFAYLDIGSVGTGILTKQPKRMTFGLAPSRARRIVHQGDTLISTVRTYLKAVYSVGAWEGLLICSTGFAVLSSDGRMDPGFMCYMAQSSTFVNRITTESVGTSYPAIAETRLGSIRIPLPPMPEQVAISRILDYVDERVRRLVETKGKLVGLLEELKASTVSEAVTGQMDVRTGHPYLAYKPSGVEWLGHIPAHWEIRRLKWISKRRVTGTTPPTSEPLYYIEGIVPWYGPSSLSSAEQVGNPMNYLNGKAFIEGKARIVRGPALLIVMIGSVGRMALMCEEGSTNQQITAFELSPKLCHPSFVLHQLRGAEAWLQSAASAATIPILDTGLAAGLQCALPPLSEQTAIAEYLDRFISKIDSVMADTFREIELLQDFRTRMIADVVTGKVDVRKAADLLLEAAV